MTQPGEVERPPGVSVAWRSAAVREVAGPAADKLAANGLPAALAAKDPGLWGPDAAAEAAIRLGWLDAPRASRALLGSLAVLASDAREQRLHLRDRAAGVAQVLDAARAGTTGSSR